MYTHHFSFYVSSQKYWSDDNDGLELMLELDEEEEEGVEDDDIFNLGETVTINCLVTSRAHHPKEESEGFTECDCTIGVRIVMPKCHPTRSGVDLYLSPKLGRSWSWL
jgi:hypothetical protein